MYLANKYISVFTVNTTIMVVRIILITLYNSCTAVIFFQVNAKINTNLSKKGIKFNPVIQSSEWRHPTHTYDGYQDSR